MKKQHLLTSLLIVGFLAAQAQSSFILPVLNKAGSNLYTIKKGIAQSIQLLFHEDNPGVSNDIWSATENGYLVSYSGEGIQHRVFLNKKGKKTSEMRYYNGFYLSNDISRQLGDAYPCFTVTGVQEIITNEMTAYVIVIENRWEWKKVRIAGKELDEMEGFPKH
ncbi:MAG: YjgB family protein [Bacteroidota bacterium]|nr:YjgB family protein [Bacteroidota bacterium]